MSAQASKPDNVIPIGFGPDGERRGLSCDVLRSRRKRARRALTISVKRMTKRELAFGRVEYPEVVDIQRRPQTRAECKDGARPCPYVSCTHHLYLDVDPRTGAIKLNFPDLEPHEMAASCSLDVADRGGEILEGVGEIMNLTRERVRQIEVKAIGKICNRMSPFRDMADDSPIVRLHLPILEES